VPSPAAESAPELPDDPIESISTLPTKKTSPPSPNPMPTAKPPACCLTASSTSS